MRHGVGFPDSLMPFLRSRRKSRLMASNRWTSKSRLRLELISFSFQGIPPISGRYNYPIVSQLSQNTLNSGSAPGLPRRRGTGGSGAPPPALFRFLPRRVKPQLPPTAAPRVLVAVGGGGWDKIGRGNGRNPG